MWVLYGDLGRLGLARRVLLGAEECLELADLLLGLLPSLVVRLDHIGGGLEELLRCCPSLELLGLGLRVVRCEVFDLLRYMGTQAQDGRLHCK